MILVVEDEFFNQIQSGCVMPRMRPQYAQSRVPAEIEVQLSHHIERYGDIQRESLNRGEGVLVS